MVSREAPNHFLGRGGAPSAMENLVKRAILSLSLLLLTGAAGGSEEPALPWRKGDAVSGSWTIQDIRRHPEFIRLRCEERHRTVWVEIILARGAPPVGWQQATRYYLVQPAPSQDAPPALLQALAKQLLRWEKRKGHVPFVTPIRKSGDRGGQGPGRPTAALRPADIVLHALLALLLLAAFWIRPIPARRILLTASLAALVVLFCAERFVMRFLAEPTYSRRYWAGMKHSSVMPPNFQGEMPHRDLGSFRFRTNSLGMRDKEYPPSLRRRAKGLFRILVLGNSHTFGYGVLEEETYHSILERRVKGTLLFNGAAPSMAAREQREAMFYFLEKIEPDLVLFALTDSDIIAFDYNPLTIPPNASFGERIINGCDRFINGKLPPELAVWLRVHFRHDDWGRLFKPELDAFAAKRFDDVAAIYADAGRSLGRRKPRIPIAVLLMPQLHQLDGTTDRFAGYSGQASFDHIKSRLQRAGIMVFDPLPDFRSQPNPAALFFPLDHHLNKGGHRLIAEFLERNMGRLKGPR